eukprot:scaffold58116_cov24-Attheya_sp.AAC.2
MAETDVEKSVMKLFEFVRNRQINSEEAHVERQRRLKKNEVEKRRTRACDILTRTEPETAIKVTKLTYPDDDEGVVKGTPGGEGMQTVTRAQLIDLKMYRLHIPAEHLNEKERKDKQRRNTRMSVRERLHYENE